MVVETLLAMKRGGMHDQLGGGFHRYSVDEYWFVPHFEKMLYDQAQLVVSYLEASRPRGNGTLADAARRTLDYVMREMTSPGGGFYSAEDADSAADPAHPQGQKRRRFLHLGVARGGGTAGRGTARPGSRFDTAWSRTATWRTIRIASSPGRNILFEAHSVEETAGNLAPRGRSRACSRGIGKEPVSKRARKRPRPHLDDKILTAWNGLMISAFAKGAAILE